ncbi:MAG: HD domain-containing phosphohydrolase [Desulfobulbaceae bacterium]|nr:HD domain-containing phosphohydrolase [Desulfobulbaceae bacterium]
MISTKLFSILLIIPGILFMIASLVMSTAMRQGVPRDLHLKWSAMTYLILFFMAGYIAFLVIQLLQLAFPLALLTSTVFFGGSIFVFLVMLLTRVTVSNYNESEKRISQANAALVAKNAELEQEIAFRRKAEKTAGIRLQHLTTLHTVDLMITSNLDLKVIMTTFLEHIVPQLEVDAADVLLFNPYTQSLEFGAGVGFTATAIQDAKVRLGTDDPAAKAAVARKIIQIDNISETEIPFNRTALLAEEKFTGYCAIPLIAKGQIKGVFEIFRKTGPISNEEWFEFLEALGVQAAIAIDNATLFNELQASNTELIIAYDSTIEGWGRALELRDRETEGHTQRVADLTVRVARAYGLGEKEIVHIRRGALLHDIGKMGIPDSVLMKDGPLTPEEEELMHKHPVYAFELLFPIAYLRPALDIPYCHHEKWDGTGYPRELKGEQIPLAARIFALADIWDALISERRYHKPWPREKVARHIRSLAGTHFDPDLVEVFMANV